MGSKGGSSKVAVDDYQMSMHLGLCAAPVDAITAVWYGEKKYWSGIVRDNVTVPVSNTGLFGGNKKEGGVYGNMTFLLGHSDQVVPDWFAQKLGRANGADCPGFRGIVSVIHTGPTKEGYAGWYWGSNTPYLKSMWYTVTSVPRTLSRDYAEIGIFTSDKVSLFFCLDDSGSMLGTRMATLKTAMSITIDRLKQAMIGVGLKLDIGGCRFNGGSFRRKNATTSDLDDFNAWVQATPASGTTDFLAGITPAVAWFNETAHDSTIGRRVNVFVTDGVPNTGTAESAAAYAADLLNRTIPVDMYGINIDLPDTTYTAMLDNTSSDGIPVVNGDHREGLLNAVLNSIYGQIDANPAHIIFEVLTNRTFGMGQDPATSINVGSFNAAARTLYNERLGLSMAWATSTTAEDFINDIKNHINGVIFTDPETGKITLKLIRDDYSGVTLREINPDNGKITTFSRKAWGDTINEVVVTWTNPASENEETVTLQDNGNIAEQGEVVSDAKNYYGVRSADLAWQLAARDLRVASAPLCSVEVELDRSFWNLKPGECVKVTWPEYGIANLTMRVWEVKYGKRGSSKITASLTEDIFSLATSEFVRPPSTEWVDSTAEPEPVDESAIITLPGYAVTKIGGVSLSSVEYPTAYAGLLASAPNADTRSFDALARTTDVTSAVVWEDRGLVQISGRGNLPVSLVAEPVSTLTGLSSQFGTPPARAVFMVIGTGAEHQTEWALITDDVGGTFTVKRGIFDTVPRDWPAGSPVWYIDQTFPVGDETPQSAGSSPQYKFLTETSSGQLNDTVAPIVSGTLTDRVHCPLRPANVKVNGVAFGELTMPIAGVVDVTWSRRNRLTEDSTVLAWNDGDVAPEAGQTTSVVLVDPITGNEFHRVDGLAGVSASVDVGAAMAAASVSTTAVLLGVEAVRDGLSSIQSHFVKINMPWGYGLNYGGHYG